jgi:hypothetical protein
MTSFPPNLQFPPLALVVAKHVRDAVFMAVLEQKYRVVQIREIANGYLRVFLSAIRRRHCLVTSQDVVRPALISHRPELNEQERHLSGCITFRWEWQAGGVA